MHFPRPTSCLVSVREFFGSVKIFHAATCLVRNCRMKIETITCQLKDKKQVSQFHCRMKWVDLSTLN